MEKTISFERGNQARLDVTREELKTIQEVLQFEKMDARGNQYDAKSKTVKDFYGRLAQKYDAVEKKVREALDRSE
jgi:hypothetical protein